MRQECLSETRTYHIPGIDMIKTVRARFILTTIIFTMVAVAFPSFFLLLQLKHNFTERSEIMLKTTLSLIDMQLENAMLTRERDINDLLHDFSRNEAIKNIRVYDRDGIVHYSTDYKELGRSIAQITTPSAKKKDGFKVFDNKKIFSAGIPLLNKPACKSCHMNDGNTLGYIDVDVRFTKAEEYFYTGVRHTVLMALAFSIFLIVGLIFIFQKYINVPLKRIRESFQKVEEGDLNVSLESPYDDEFGALMSRFNHMVRRLKKTREELDKIHFEQLQRADKLVTLGELAAELAHEINNPAGIIMTHADYIQLDARENKALKKYEDDLEIIIDQVNKISSITSNILRYSKKRPKSMEEIDLPALLSHCLTILQPVIRKKRARVETRFDQDARVWGDAGQLDQVFINVINNALDALPQEGGRLKLEIRLEPQAVSVTVSDNGQGIPEKEIDQIFLPFYSTKGEAKGTGLGLYIVKNICQNHNAEVKVASRPGKGTAITIIFPKEGI